MSAIAWVRGRTLANAVRAPGSALMGNSAPAKNHGRIATTGVAPMYSSWLGMRLAIVSATPYMKTAKPTAAPTNQAMPVALTWKSAPRSAATPTSTATCSALSASATSRLPSTSSAPRDGRGEQLALGAAVAVDDDAEAGEDRRRAGTSRPTVPIETKAV